MQFVPMLLLPILPVLAEGRAQVGKPSTGRALSGVLTNIEEIHPTVDLDRSNRPRDAPLSAPTGHPPVVPNLAYAEWLDARCEMDATVPAVPHSPELAQETSTRVAPGATEGHCI